MGMLDRPIRDVELGLNLAILCQLVENTASQQTIDEAVRGLGNGLPISVLNRDSTAFPNLYFASVGNYSLLILGCVKSAGMGIQLMNGYSPLANLPPIAIQNAWGRNAVIAIKTYLAANVRLFPPNFVLAGHSGGGLVCQCYSYALATQATPQSTNVITFGSPRAGGPTFATQVNTHDVSTVRYMNTEDPVPLIPPSVSDGLGFATIFGPSDSTFYARWVHTDGGRVINPDGSFLDAVLPPTANLAPVVNLGAFVYSVDTVSGRGHTIQEYINRLGLAVPTPNAPPNLGPSLAPQEQRDVPSRRQANQAQAATQAAVFADSRKQHLRPVAIPKESEFHAVREGLIWAVTFQGQFVAYAPQKKTARQLANAGNKFLRSLQHQGIVDSVAINAQFLSYLSQASDPQGGFVPVMNTSFPA